MRNDDAAETPTSAVGGLRALLLRILPRPTGRMAFFRPKAIRPHSSLLSAVREHGPIGASRRLAPILLTNVAAGTALFRVYERLHSRFAGRRRVLLDAAACGAAGGLAHALIACPLTAACAGQWHAPFAALRVMLVRDMVGFSAFFASWVGFQTVATPARGSRAQDLCASVAGGGIAGGAYAVWSLPFDLGRARAKPSLRALAIELQRIGAITALRRASGSARGAVFASSMSFLAAELIFEEGLCTALLAELSTIQGGGWI